ncbi:MAG: hypothetical protein ACE5JX_21690 [Acidobacteriota bacterium]
MLTNVTEQGLRVTPRFYVEGVALASQRLDLRPHEYRVLNVDEGLGAGAQSVLEGGLRLEVDGPPGSLMARGFVEDPARGFSSNLTFLDPQMPQTKRLHGAQLFMGQTDALPGLPQGISFTAWLLLRNTTAREMQVDINVRYSIRSNAGIAGRARIPSLRLGRQEVRRINIKEWLVSAVQIPEQIHSAGVTARVEPQKGTSSAKSLCVYADSLLVS